MTNEMTQMEERVAEMLFEVGAVKFGAFKLKLHEKNPDAPLSPVFLNLRTPDNPKPGPLRAPLVELIGEALYSRHCAAHLEFDHVAGVPRAGDPFAHAFYRVLARRSASLIKLSKKEDNDRREVTSIFEGTHAPGDTALLIDDLITRADSKLEAIRVLENAELVVKDVLVLVDREQGGTKELANAGYRLHAVFTLTRLLDFYVTRRMMTEAKRDEVVAYLASNG